MSNIKKTFTRLRIKKETALIMYLMAGDPEMAVTKSLILDMEKAGCDIIELGVPFSDPLADGPTIQKAAIRSLENHTSLSDVLGLVTNVREISRIPLVFMTYYNLIFKYGEERFVNDAVSAGLDGIILPDLPPEEARALIRVSKKAGLDMIFLLAPTSTDERIKLVCKLSQGFIYYVSLTGVTGSKLGTQNSIQDALSKIKVITDKPVAVGFGISTPAQAAQIASCGADGVIVGSALVKMIEEHIDDQEKIIYHAAEFTRTLKRELLTKHRGQ
ncbi:MAG TPA: tryptophan synthase subunit alpha [Nitrospirota bacterium]|nr:tryptophan synthase subunit alpha [Nitrospirota bacterium]